MPPNFAGTTVHSGQTQKATSLPVFQSLKVWISSVFYEREVRMKTTHIISQQTKCCPDKTCGCQLPHFEHILNVNKLRLSGNSVTFCDKRQTFDVCLYFPLKNYGGHCTRMVCLTAVKGLLRNEDTTTKRSFWSAVQKRGLFQMTAISGEVSY